MQTSENARTRAPSILTAKNPNSLAISQPPADAKASPPLMEVSIVMVLPSTLKAEVPPVLPLLESLLPLLSLLLLLLLPLSLLLILVLFLMCVSLLFVLSCLFV